MLQLAIIDDEPKIRSFLRSIITEQLSDVTIVGEAGSVKTGLSMLAENKPQALLLDVEMSDGTGFDLLSQLDTFHPHVIFITAYDHYAVQALRAGAVDYIEKPIHPEELLSGLQKVQQLVAEEVQPNYPQLLQSVKSEIREKIAIPTRSGLQYLTASEILYIKADGAYAQIHTEGEVQPLVISRTLKDIQPVLSPLGFIRLHRSYLVNASKVKELSKADGGYLVLTNGLQVPFSKQYKETALRMIQDMTTFL